MVFKSAEINRVSVSDGSRVVGGSVFRRVGPETAKLLCPYLVVLERGTARSPCIAEWRCLPLTDADTGVTISARYIGAVNTRAKN